MYGFEGRIAKIHSTSQKLSISNPKFLFGIFYIYFFLCFSFKHDTTNKHQPNNQSHDQTPPILPTIININQQICTKYTQERIPPDQ
ncbi:hypothetical protein Hanom_Chr07g00595391 [Helianthus anomalus]